MARRLEVCQAELRSVLDTLGRERDRSAGLEAEVTSLSLEVSGLKADLSAEQDRLRKMWQLHCERLSRWDNECADKDTEIEQLKARLATAGAREPVSHPGMAVGVSPALSTPPTVTTGPVPLPTVSTSSMSIPPPISGLASVVTTPGTVTTIPALSGISSITPAITAVPKVTTSFSSVGMSHIPVVAHPLPSTTTSPCIVTGPCVAAGVCATPHAVSHIAPYVASHAATTVVPGGMLATPRRGKAPPVDSYSGEDAEIRLEDWIPTLERAASWNGWSPEECLLQLAGHLRGRALAEWNLLGVEEKATYQAATQALHLRLDPGSRVLAAQDFRHAVQRENEPVADFVRRVERCFQLAYGHDKLSRETRETILYGQLQEGLRYSIIKSLSGSQSYKDLCMAAKNEEKRLAELQRRQQYQKGGNKTGSSNNTQPPTGKKTEQPNKQSGSQSASAWRRKCYRCGSTEHVVKNCKASKSESTVRPEGKSGARQVHSQVDPRQYLYSSDSDEAGEVLTVRVEDKGSKPRKVTVDVQGVPAEGVVDTGADITIMGADLFKRVAAVAHLKKKELKKSDRVPFTYDQKPFRLDGKLELDITFQGQTMCTPVYLKMDAHDSLLLSEGVCCQLGIITYHPSLEVQQPTNQRTTARVPGVSVRLVKSMRLAPQQTAMVTVRIDGDYRAGEPLLVEPNRKFISDDGSELHFGDSLVSVSEDGCAQVSMTNPTGFTRKLARGILVGNAQEVTHVDSGAFS